MELWQVFNKCKRWNLEILSKTKWNWKIAQSGAYFRYHRSWHFRNDLTWLHHRLDSVIAFSRLHSPQDSVLHLWKSSDISSRCCSTNRLTRSLYGSQLVPESATQHSLTNSRTTECGDPQLVSVTFRYIHLVNSKSPVLQSLNWSKKMFSDFEFCQPNTEECRNLSTETSFPTILTGKWTWKRLCKYPGFW
jgi:hypothetical protein